jgi:hypothetical protein
MDDHGSLIEEMEIMELHLPQQAQHPHCANQGFAGYQSNWAV